MYVLWILENNVESRKRWLLDSIMHERNDFFSSKVLSICMFIFGICVAVCRQWIDIASDWFIGKWKIITIIINFRIEMEIGLCWCPDITIAKWQWPAVKSTEPVVNFVVVIVIVVRVVNRQYCSVKLWPLTQSNRFFCDGSKISDIVMTI